MPEKRLRIVGVPPGARGLSAGLSRCVRPGAVVTSFDDRLFRAIRTMVGDDVELVPMGDLLGRFLTMLGRPQLRIPSAGQRAAMVAVTASSLGDATPLARALRHPGTVRLLEELLSQLRDWGVEADELGWLAARVEGDLAEKLATMAEVATLVRDSMDATQREYGTDRIARIREAAVEAPLPISHLVAVVGSEERPLYEEWLAWCAGRGIRVDVVVEHAPERPDLFALGQRIAARLQARIEQAGSLGWAAAVSRPGGGPWTGEAPSLEAFSAANPLAESEWVVRRCLRLVKGGVAPERIGIVARDAETYWPFLRTVSEAMGLPVSMVRSAPLLSSGLATVVVRLLRALAGRDVRRVARLAQSGVFRLSREERAAVWEAACEAARAGIEPGVDAWERLAEWAGRQEGRLAWVVRALAWRREALDGPAPLTGWSARFRDLVGEVIVADRAPHEDAELQARDERAATVLQAALSEYAFVHDQAGQPELGFPAFLRTAEALWEQRTLTLPTEPGGVAVETRAGDLPDVDHVFAIGLLEGTFPKRRREDPILSDEERAVINRLGGVALTDSCEENRTELDELVRLCAAPRLSLTLSYPLTDGDRDTIPSFAIEGVFGALGLEPRVVSHPRSEPVPPIESCGSAWERSVRRALDGPRVAPAAVSLRSDVARSTVRPDFAAGVSLREVASAATCAFQAAARHRLRLWATGAREGHRALAKLPLEGALALASDPEQAREALLAQLEARLDRLWPLLEEWEVAMLRSAGSRLVELWTRQEFEARRVWPREPGSVTLSAPLGACGLKGGKACAGENVRLVGTVDGVMTVAGGSVAIVYGGSLAAVKALKDGIVDSDSLPLALLLLVQHGRGAWSGLEVVALGGGRVLFQLAPPEALPANVHEGLERLKLDQAAPLLRETVREFERAVGALRKADMRPSPGRHCERCDLVELCRSAMGLADDDPFLSRGGER